MKSLLYYFIQVTTCSGILYGYYHFFLRNKKFHIYNRFYLLIAAIISILVPFVNIPVYFSANDATSSFVLKTITSISPNELTESSSVPVLINNHSQSAVSLLYCSYILVSITMIGRILLSLRKIRRIKKKYPVQKLNAIYFVNTTEPGTPFSFFRWLFWNQKIDARSEKGEQVFRHELFHIEQRHSLDILYMELLTTIFWINPFLHLIKREIKVIHEFLADQFAVHQSKSWEYAELLLMQSLNTDHHLTNPFFYNQIKRRIAMITSSQKTNYQYLRKIMVLPVATIVVALFAFSYKNKKENSPVVKFHKSVTVVIDAGHGMDPSGSHTGVTAPDGSHEDDIVLSIAKKIKELNTNDRLRITLTRENKDIVDLKKRVEFSNSQNAELLISLHTNAASKQEPNTKGIDIMFSGKNEKYYAESKIFSTILYNFFHQIHPVNDITSSKNKVYVIDNSNCPSALIECGYLTDPMDLAFVKDETGQAQIAKSILQSIEQYFLQKEGTDWEERKTVVSDTAWPEIKFDRNTTTGKMEGSYNGKKFNKMTDHNGQLAFLFDDDSSTMIMISKEQTAALKKKYGANLNELITKDVDNGRDRESREKEQRELKEMLEQKQTQSEKAQAEIKQLMEDKQLKAEKQQPELKDLWGMKQLEMEKTQQELKELMNLKELKIEGQQLELKERLDTLQNTGGEKAMKKMQIVRDNQRNTEKMQKELEQILVLKQQEADKNVEELKKLMLMNQKEMEMNAEKLEKLLKEEQRQTEEKSKTNNKKVKS